MSYLVDPNDIEPLDAYERCDAVYGAYHIGRDDESRAEVALFFDPRWLPEPDFLRLGMWSILNRHSGRLLGLSECDFTRYSKGHCRELLQKNMVLATNLAELPTCPWAVAVVELAGPSLWPVDTALRVYTAYVGYADISWPTHFRSHITTGPDFIHQ